MPAQLELFIGVNIVNCLLAGGESLVGARPKFEFFCWHMEVWGFQRFELGFYWFLME